MRSIRRILVAIKDPEVKTTPALVKAGQLAQALGAQIELFHGIATPLYADGYGPSSIELPTIERHARTRTLALLERLCPVPVLLVKTRGTYRNPRDAAKA